MVRINFALQRACTEKVSPARRWGVSGRRCRRTRQGAYARPLTIPADSGPPGLFVRCANVLLRGGSFVCRAGHALQRAGFEQVMPARRWGVSGCPCRRTRQGADARPLTIPASGSLRAPLCGVPSSRPAASGPSGRAIPGANRPFADVLSAHPGLWLFLSASDASGKPLLVGLLPGSAGCL